MTLDNRGKAFRSRPGVGVISLAQNAGGVAYVGRLLRRALRDAGADPWIAELGVERRDTASLAARARFAMRLLAAQATRRVDWMLFNHVGVARAQRAIPRSLRRPYGVFVHDVEAWDPDLDESRLRTLADASVVISNSAYTARRVEAAHGSRVSVFPCPLGLFDREPVAGVPDRELLEKCSRPTALIVGRIMADERYKGHDQLIEAWPAVREAIPGAQLVIAGWGDDIPRLRQKASALSVADDVTFADYVNEATLVALFANAAVYAMPSSREGFGLVYLEAMRNGIPCIGSTLDAASEVIAHGESGFVVDRGNPRELVGALVRLLGDPIARATMGAAGQRRFRQQFTYDHFRDRLLPILERTMPGFRSAAPGAPRGELPFRGLPTKA